MITDFWMTVFLGLVLVTIIALFALQDAAYRVDTEDDPPKWAKRLSDWFGLNE